MIAILTENYGHTYVAGIYENKKAAERALLKFIQVDCGYPRDPRDYRWMEFTFGETCFEWYEGKIIELVGDKINFTQKTIW